MSEYIKKEDAIESIIHHRDLTWCYDARAWAEELLEDADVITEDKCDGNYEDEIQRERDEQTVSWDD